MDYGVILPFPETSRQSVANMNIYNYQKLMLHIQMKYTKYHSIKKNLSQWQNLFSVFLQFVVP